MKRQNEEIYKKFDWQKEEMNEKFAQQNENLKLILSKLEAH